MSFSVYFVCDKTVLADAGAIAAHERILCSILIYKCEESFYRVSLWCVCVCVYDEAKGGKFYRLLHTFKCQLSQNCTRKCVIACMTMNRIANTSAIPLQ